MTERYGATVSDSLGDVVLHAAAQDYFDVCEAALSDGFDQLIDLTAVDFLTYRGRRELPEGIEAGRFEVVVSLLSHVRRERIRIRVHLGDDQPSLASIFDLYPGAENLEREVFDMFGIDFAGHPDMSRVLMPEDWEGHPLRKDYAVGAIPVRFTAASSRR